VCGFAGVGWDDVWVQLCKHGMFGGQIRCIRGYAGIM
jgi:hypothetical protein